MLDPSATNQADLERIQSALENVTTNVMIADSSFKIVYMNRSLVRMFQTAEEEIRRDLPSFRADGLIGRSIDDFHRDPSHQRKLLGSLTGAYQTRLDLGSRSFDLIATVARGADGTTLGYAVEWADISDRLREEQAKETAFAEAQRVRSALDTVTTNVMIANADFEVVYMNDSLVRMFQAAEADIRQDLPQFRMEGLLGRCIDAFHKDPSHQRALLSQLKGAYNTQLELGGRTFDLTATTARDSDGKIIGYAVEWADLTESLKVEQAQARAFAEAQRVRAALDTVTTNVMIADVNFAIVYMNRAVREMFERAEADIRREIPHFRADGLVGRCIDDFHKDPSHQRKLLTSLRGDYKADLSLGGRTFNLIATAGRDEDGQVVGYAVEWADITEQLDAESQVEGVIQAATRGELERRLDTRKYDGFMRTLGDGVNRLLQVVTEPVAEVVQVADRLAQGDLSTQLEGSYEGEFLRLKNSMNNFVQFNREISQDLVRVAERMAKGDLTVSLGAQYQGDFRKIQDGFEEALGGLNDVLNRSKEIVEQVAQASVQLQSTSQSMSSVASEQSTATEESSSALQQAAGMVKANAENAGQANELVNQTVSAANQGQGKMEQMSAAMDAIARSSQEISKIIKVIDEIAFQTNLLALNAAVEAARAGRHGKGFAVVAQEVRNLAGRSASAAKETAELIEEAGRTVQGGVQIADSTGEALEQIVGNVVKVRDLVAEISTGSDEQARGIDDVNRAMSQVNQGSQAVSEQSAELAASSDELSRQTEILQEAIGRFNLRSVRQVSQQDLAAQLPSNLTPEMLQELLAKLEEMRRKGVRGPGSRPTARAKDDDVDPKKVLPLDEDERGFDRF